MKNKTINTIYKNIICVDEIKKNQIKKWKNKICPDEIIGFVEIDKDKNIKFNEREDYKDLFLGIEDHDSYCNSLEIGCRGKIAIILESPHIDEFFEEKIQVFNKEKNISARPANGQTGRYLRKYLCEVFEKPFVDLESGKYSISIVNSMQQQCSLGEKPLYFRDRVWAHLWFTKNEYNYSNNFINRLKKLNPDIIFNCSTVGSHYKIADNRKKYITEKPVGFTAKFLYEEYNESIDAKDAKIRNLIFDKLVPVKEFSDIKIYSSTHPSSWFSPNNRKLIPNLEK